MASMSSIVRPSGLLLHSPKYKAQEKVVTLPGGKRVRVWIDDSSTVKQVEENDALHAVVRPRSVTIKVRPVQ